VCRDALLLAPFHFLSVLVDSSPLPLHISLHAEHDQEFCVKLRQGPLLERPSGYGILVPLFTKAYHIHKGPQPPLDLATNSDLNYIPTSHFHLHSS
jgi:hypothetical protein